MSKLTVKSSSSGGGGGSSSKAFVILPPAKPQPKPKAVVQAVVDGAKAAVSTTPKTQSHQQFQKKVVLWWKSVKPVENAKYGPSRPLVSIDANWFDQLPAAFAKSVQGHNGKAVDEKLLTDMTSAAQIAYKNEIVAYQSELHKQGESTDKKWINSVINSGTWSDKIAALALRVQESPFHNLEALDLLIGIAVNKDQRSGFMAIEALKDLFLNNLLPDRPLREFSWYSSLLSTEASSALVAMLCWYEGQLASRFSQMLEVLDAGLKANIVHFRRQSMDICLELLCKKMEQESRLLSLLVNKIGDSDGKVASKACELLKSFVRQFPAMKSIVVREVRVFIYKPNTKMTVIFSAVNFLNQLRLSDGRTMKPTAVQQQRTGHLPVVPDRQLALQLAECYLSLFEKAIQAKEAGSRLLTALLNGINNVFPFLADADKNHQSLQPYMNSIFRLVHTATSFATSSQALALLSHMVIASNAAGAAQLADANTKDPANGLRDRFYLTLYNKLLANDTFQHAKNTLFLNLLYKSVKSDPNLQRAKAFVKRIAINATECAPAMTAGLLFMISEILAAKPELKAMIDAEDKAISGSGNTDKEDDNDDDDEGGRSDEQLGNYLVHKRNPLFAVPAGSTPSLFESCLLRHHFHPSVKAFTEAIVDSDQHAISFAGDPLVEFSLISFLNRFAYKNPKQKQSQAASSMSGNEDLPINAVFASGEAVDESKIAPDSHFFYKFFGEREALRAMGKSRDRKKKKSDDSDGGDDSGSDAEDFDDDDEIDRFADKLADDMMRHDAKSRGEAFGDDEDDDEVDDFDMGEDIEFPEEEEEVDQQDDSSSDDSQLIADKKSKKNKSSAAIDFEDFKKLSQSKKNKAAAKHAADEDSDEDDWAEPEAYVDSDGGEEGDLAEGDGPIRLAIDGDIDMLDDDDDDDEEMNELPATLMPKKQGAKSSKAAKKDKKKGNKRDVEDVEGPAADDDFADASLYEAEMEDIVNQFKAPDATAEADSQHVSKKSNVRKSAEKQQKRRKLR